MRPQWEYLVLTLRGYKYEKDETLRRAGYQGWELVSREGDECTFKRPLVTAGFKSQKQP